MIETTIDNQKPNLPGENSVEMILDRLLTTEPDQQMYEKAKGNLMGALEAAKVEMIFFGTIHHTLTGNIYLATRDKKLMALNFGVSIDEFTTKIEKTFAIRPYFDLGEITSASHQLCAYLNGQQTGFDLPVDLSPLTDFQRQVLHITQQIPRGQVVTYGEIARRIGNPKSVRAVGQALGHNPIPIVIPCHRVIASDGSMGGYSGGGGVGTKIKLLQLEGAVL
jgi:methylated-DNA-[protein]-cysteine S-methyltransferase